jgi:hypothetical protein
MEGVCVSVFIIKGVFFLVQVRGGASAGRDGDGRDGAHDAKNYPGARQGE